MMLPRFVLWAAAVCLLAACGESATYRPTQQSSGVDALLIGLDVVSADVVWAAGTGGTFVWTGDGGRTWHAGTVPGADSLQFRDVEAASIDDVFLLSIGPGSDSRIYRTTDRGTTWRLVFENDMQTAFYDCMDFWEDGSGLAFSDGVDGRFPIVRSLDGEQWTLPPVEIRPPAQPEEGGFAASGSCLVAVGDSTVYIATGNGPIARVLRSVDRGSSWEFADVPMEAGEAAGLTSLAFFDERHGVAFGGDLTSADTKQVTTFTSLDGGASWEAAASPDIRGAVYGSTVIPGTDGLVAVGPGGAAYSADRAGSWTLLDTLSYWSVDAAGPDAIWAVGPEGRIARMQLER